MDSQEKTGRQVSAAAAATSTSYLLQGATRHSWTLSLLPRDHSKSMWVRTGTNQETLLFLKDLLPTHRAKASSGPRALSFVSLGLGMFFAFFFLNLYYCVRVTDCMRGTQVEVSYSPPTVLWILGLELWLHRFV